MRLSGPQYSSRGRCRRLGGKKPDEFMGTADGRALMSSGSQPSAYNEGRPAAALVGCELELTTPELPSGRLNCRGES